MIALFIVLAEDQKAMQVEGTLALISQGSVDSLVEIIFMQLELMNVLLAFTN
jgi:hypothetical protein